jgi:2-methylcitrate dehydratase (2-methyl-trans-aconitate forming)
MNKLHRKALPGSALDYFDAREAVEGIKPGAWAGLSYTARVHAENLVRRCDPAILTACLTQIIERKRDLDFPWFPARVVCHDILGQTALVDLAGLRDAISDQGGDPAQVNPVVPVQLIVDHSLAVECGGFDPNAFEKNRAIEDRRNGPVGLLRMSMSFRPAMASCIKLIWSACRRLFSRLTVSPFPIL